MAHFYLLETLESTTVGSTIVLDGAEGRHAATVSRVRAGEPFSLGNGRGLVVAAEVLSTSKDTVELRVDSVEQMTPETPQIYLVQVEIFFQHYLAVRVNVMAQICKPKPQLDLKNLFMALN